MIEPKFVECIAKEVSVRPEQVAAAIAFLDKGATVPFVARYRKDATGNLSETQIERIAKRNGEFTALSNRRDAVLQNIEKQGLLSEALRSRIEEVADPLALEDLYLLFKKQRRTKSSLARDHGLEPLADLLWAQDSGETTPEALAGPFVSPSHQVPDCAAALAGARFILAERIAMDPDVRILLRERMLEQGKVVSRQALRAAQQAEIARPVGEILIHTERTAANSAATTAEKRPLPPKALAEVVRGRFKPYHDFSEPVKSIRAHHLLAVLRGARLGALRVDLEVDDAALLDTLRKHLIKTPDAPMAAEMEAAAEDAYRRLLRPALESEIFDLIREQADEEAVWTFRKNTRNVLLAPAAGRIPVIGVDPGLRSGCRLAVVDASGSFVESAALRTDDEHKAESARIFLELARKHGVQAVAIGNGTGARDVGYFIEKILAESEDVAACTFFVNEAGAVVYASSKAAREEFPEIDATLRTAISIARRLQNPLAELVKVEPRSVGIGQHQHDVNQRMLRDGLYKTVESCVNLVGADLNTASVELLRYVSGIQMGTAQNIVAYRTEHGAFKNRQQLKDVPGIGEKTFEQCAGFLRIFGGDTPLDATALHPEAYPVADRIAASLGVSVPELLANPSKLDGVDFEPFAAEPLGALAMADLRREFQRPGRDPRRRFRGPSFLPSVKSIADLQGGMVTEGMVTNVTDFGAFVDIGVLQDGLIHLSEIANRFVRDPRDHVQVGDIIKVKVVAVDKESKRISLSIKALAGEARRKPRQGSPTPGEERAPRPEHRSEHRDDRPRRGPTAGGRDTPPGDGVPPRQGPPRRHPAKPAKSNSSAPKPPRPPMRSGSEEPIGTSLAEQLLALREKFEEK